MRTLAALLLLSAAAVAGEAAITEEFVINAPLERVVTWSESHADELRDAINVRLVERDGDVLTLQRRNNRGNWVWRQRESLTRGNGDCQYESTLVECLEGGIERMSGTVSMREAGGKTKIVATTTAAVNGVKDRELEYDLKNRARRIRKAMQEGCE